MKHSFLLAFLFAASVHAESSPPSLRLAPAALGETISVSQHLSVDRENRKDELDVALEVDQDHVELVGLAFGMRVMTMHFDGKDLKSWRHPFMPSQVRAEDVLQDIQLTLWPIEAIREALPQGWRIEENDRCRTLYLDDKPMLKIDYGGEHRWSGTVTLSNLRYGYRLTIQNVQ